MARIRTIKPETWTSEQVMNLSPLARLAFIGLWNFCDDGGNHPASARTLKAEVFPSDDIAATNVESLVAEMLGQKLLVTYEAGSKTFWHVTGWHHQRIDKPTFKHPPFSGESATARRAVTDESAPTPRAFDEHSSNDRRIIDAASTPEWKGEEGKGEEGKGEEDKDKDKDKDKEAIASVGGGLPLCKTQAIVDLYHEVLPDLPAVRLMSDSRKRALSKLWRWALTTTKPDGSRRATDAEGALAWFGDYFNRTRDNDFLMGRGQKSPGHEGWRCDLDFLLTEKGMKHVIEKTAEVAA
jgi:hypothetical protein